MKGRRSIKELCAYLGISRSGYYAYRKRKWDDPDSNLKHKIRVIYEQRNKIVGYRRIQDELFRQHQLVVNHKKVLRLMRELGIRAIIRRKYVHRTSYEAAVSDGRIAENLLQRDFRADGPNKKWVTDVTQYRVFDNIGHQGPVEWRNRRVSFQQS